MSIKRLSKTSYPGVDDLISLAEKEGLADGWTAAESSDGFEQMVRAEIQIRDRRANGDVELDPNEQIEKIKNLMQSLELKKQDYEIQRTTAACAVSDRHLRWQRCARIVSFFGLTVLLLGFMGVRLNWQGWLAFSLGAAFVILRPMGACDSIRRGFIRSREDLSYAKNCCRLWRLNARVGKTWTPIVPKFSNSGCPNLPSP
jgi:hypothetical protein